MRGFRRDSARVGTTAIRRQLEVQQSASRFITFLRAANALILAWTLVESGGDAYAVPLRDVFQADAFRQGLTNEAVRILVAAALPRMMRCRERETGWQRRFQLFVAMKFGAGVGGNRVHRPSFRAKQLARPRIEFDARPSREFADPRQPRLAIVMRVAFAKWFIRAPQMHVPRTTLCLVAPDVAINRFVADRQPAIARISPRDLLGAPISAQQRVHALPVRDRALRTASRVRPARDGVRVRRAGLVIASERLAVALELARDRATMALQLAPNRGSSQSLHPEGSAYGAHGL